jgi:hypothetical protein
MEVRVKWWGKSSPPDWRQSGQGKPYGLKDQISWLSLRGIRVTRPMPVGRSIDFGGDSEAR